MTKKEHVFISIGATVAGLLLCGFAMATTLGDPVSTICVVLGLMFSVGGFISCILALKRSIPKNK